MKAEEEEETPYLIFTILDEDNHIIRQLRAPARKGLQRVVWDLEYPDLRPANARDASPTSSGPSSTFALPGKYSVYLSKWVAGETTQLTEPVAFNVTPLGFASLPAEDKAALVEFQKKVKKLSHAVNAASSVLGELSTRIQLYKVALKSVTVPHKEIYADIKALEKKLADIQIKMYGDRTLSRIDLDAQPGLTRRIGTIIGEQRNSTSAPTQTQLDNYKITEEEFEPIYTALKQIIEEDIKNIEKKLDNIGAPYTPGRLINWK